MTIEGAVAPEAWRVAAASLGLTPGHLDGQLAWRGQSAGHDITIALDIASLERARISVVVWNGGIGDRLSVAPLAHALTREGRFLTGDIALDRRVVIHGERPEVACPWDAPTRALAGRLVGELGGWVVASAVRLGPAATARATEDHTVADALQGAVDLATRLASGRSIAEQLDAIAAGDPSESVRAVYAQILAEVAPTGALGEDRARLAIDAIDSTSQTADDAFDTLARSARETPNAQVREQALVKLLQTQPLERVEPLLLDTEDALGVRVRDALVAAMHRATPPYSAVALLRLMARTPLGPAGLQAAAGALGATQDPAAFARLAALCQHPDEPVWTTALGSIMNLRLKPNDLISNLEKAGRDALFDRLAEIALLRRPTQAVPILEALLARSPSHARASAYRHALEVLSAPPVAPAAPASAPASPPSDETPQT
ncbi:MAG: hypothetical protein U1F43_10100 [Myxococcota bacterium]